MGATTVTGLPIDLRFSDSQHDDHDDDDDYDDNDDGDDGATTVTGLPIDLRFGDSQHGDHDNEDDDDYDDDDDDDDDDHGLWCFHENLASRTPFQSSSLAFWSTAPLEGGLLFSLPEAFNLSLSKFL